jgi:hypothetical protein
VFWNPPAFSEEEAMHSRYPVEVRRQVVELARSGTRVAQLAETFGMSEAVIYGKAVLLVLEPDAGRLPVGV